MTIGSLAVNIIADTNKFSRPISRARVLLGKFTQSVKRAAFVVTTLGIALASLGAAATVGFGIKKAFRDIGELAKGKISEISKAIRDLGLQLDKRAVRAIVRANEAVLRLQASFQAIFRHMAAELAPLIEVIANNITSIVASPGRVQSIAKGFVGVIIKGIGLVADIMQQAGRALVRFASIGIDFINQLRGSNLAGQLGIAAPSVEDFELGGMLREFLFQSGLEKNKLSNVLNSTLARVRGKIDKDVKQESAKKLFDFLSSKVPGIADSFDAAKKGISGFARSVELTRDSLLINFLKAQFSPATEGKAKREGRLAPLAALEAGTAEAFAASRKNITGQGTKTLEGLGEKQLATQIKIEAGIEKLVGNPIPQFSI